MIVFVHIIYECPYECPVFTGSGANMLLVTATERKILNPNLTSYKNTSILS
jgi:hypothetical protein